MAAGTGGRVLRPYSVRISRQQSRPHPTSGDQVRQVVFAINRLDSARGVITRCLGILTAFRQEGRGLVCEELHRGRRRGSTKRRTAASPIGARCIASQPTVRVPAGLKPSPSIVGMDTCRREKRCGKGRNGFPCGKWTHPSRKSTTMVAVDLVGRFASPSRSTPGRCVPRC